MASTHNSYVSSYTNMKTTKYPVDDPRLVVPTLAVPAPRFSLLPLTSTTYLRPPKSIPNRPKKCFNNGNQNHHNQTGNVITRTGCEAQEMFRVSNSFGQNYCEDGMDFNKFENLMESSVLKEGEGQPKDNCAVLINKEPSALIKQKDSGSLFVPSKAKSSLSGEQTTTINSSNSINKNINSDQTDSPIIKSKWNVSSPSALIPAINSGSKCLMGHKEVLTASLHTTLVRNQPPLTSDCYPPVTAQMEAPSVSHGSPLLYDSVNAAACQYINYNKHMLEIKQQLVEERVRPSNKQLIGTQNQDRYHHANERESQVKETDNVVSTTDLSSTDNLNFKENYLNGKNNPFNDVLKNEGLLNSENEFKEQYLFTNMPIKLEENNTIDYAAEAMEQFNGLDSTNREVNKNKMFYFHSNYFSERGLNDTNDQIRPEEDFLNKEGGTVVKEDTMSLTSDVAANGIADVSEDIDGQAVKRVSHSTLAALYHSHNHHRQSGQNSSNANTTTITTTTTTAVQYIDKTTTFNSCNTSPPQLAEPSSSNQGYQHLSRISTQVIKSDNTSETDRVTAGAVPEVNGTREDININREHLQFTEKDNITSANNEAGGELLIFNQGKASGENHLLIDSNEEVHEEDTMEGDIDVETSSNSSRSNSPVVDLRKSKQAKLDKSSPFNKQCGLNPDDPQDLSMKTKTKTPMIIAALPSSMDKLSDFSSSKYITIEPAISPYHDRYDHKDYRCSPPGLHVIVPNTINQAAMTTTTSTTNNRLNSESINTKLGGGQCIGDKNGQVHHNNVAVINYGKRHNANDCNGKMSNNGQRENGHNLAAVDGVNGGNKYSNNKTSGSFTVHTMVCDSNGSSPHSIYSTGLATATDNTQLTNTTTEQGNNEAVTCSGSGEKEDSDLHIIVDQDFSDSEEQQGEDDVGSKRLRMTPGDGADMNGRQEGGLAEGIRHLTAGEDGPITPDENEHDAQHRDSASAKDSDEVIHSSYLLLAS